MTIGAQRAGPRSDSLIHSDCVNKRRMYVFCCVGDGVVEVHDKKKSPLFWKSSEEKSALRMHRVTITARLFGTIFYFLCLVRDSQLDLSSLVVFMWPNRLYPFQKYSQLQKYWDSDTFFVFVLALYSNTMIQC